MEMEDNFTLNNEPITIMVGTIFNHPIILFGSGI